MRSYSHEVARNKRSHKNCAATKCVFIVLLFFLRYLNFKHIVLKQVKKNVIRIFQSSAAQPWKLPLPLFFFLVLVLLWRSVRMIWLESCIWFAFHFRLHRLHCLANFNCPRRRHWPHPLHLGHPSTKTFDWNESPRRGRGKRISQGSTASALEWYFDGESGKMAEKTRFWYVIL